MLYVFHGTDVAKSSEKAHALIDSLRVKRPDAAFEEIGADRWDVRAIESHLGGRIILEQIHHLPEPRDRECRSQGSSAGLIASLNESPNVFIVLEGKLNAELKRAVEKDAEKRSLRSRRKAAAKEASTSSLWRRGRLGRCIQGLDLYRQAVDAGAESEALIGMLFWKAKTMARARSRAGCHALS